MVVIFMLHLQEFFQVPRFQRYSPDKTELVATFISFLLQLLDYETEFTVSCEDQIFCLKRELRYLVAILGDTPFQGGDDELERMKKLLTEFEAEASEAGPFVRSFIFTTQEIFKYKRMDKALGVLLEHIELLKANIIEFSNSLPIIANDNMKEKTCPIESNFIVDSVLHDQVDLLSRGDDQIVDVKDQVKLLHEGLMLSQSLLKEIKLPRHSELDKLNELARQTRDVAYETEYLINTFFIGYAPVWYLTVRFPHVIQKIELIAIGLQEIKKNYDSGALQIAEDLSSQLSPQRKRKFGECFHLPRC